MHHGCSAVFAFQGMEIEDMALVAVENEFRKKQHEARREKCCDHQSFSREVQGHQSGGVCSRNRGTSSQETLKDFAAISAGIACQVVWFSSCSAVHINNTDLLSLSFPFPSSFFLCKYKPQSPFVSPERVGAPFQQLFRCEAVQHSKIQL